MRTDLRVSVLFLVLSSLSCAEAPVGPNDNGWRLLRGHLEPFSLPAFRNGRECWVYLPPAYAVTARRYAVLYVNDGQYAFDRPSGLRINRICEDLIRRGEIDPIIVVAIPSTSPRERGFDYVPRFEDPSSSGGDFYLRAIRDTLKPAIDRRYRTLTDPLHTAMTGGSLGGLISAYAGLAYDSTFGMVAAFSPSYHWTYPSIPQYARDRGRPALLSRFYQATGYPQDNRIDEMEAVLLEQGYVLGVDFLSITVPGAIHWFDAWQRQLPGMLRFLFPPTG